MVSLVRANLSCFFHSSLRFPVLIPLPPVLSPSPCTTLRYRPRLDIQQATAGNHSTRCSPILETGLSSAKVSNHQRGCYELGSARIQVYDHAIFADKASTELMQSLYSSFDNGPPTTRSRTPTSPSYQDLFQTPRLDTDFLDTKSSWSSNDVSSSFSDLLKTPRALPFNTPTAASPVVASRNYQDGATLLGVNAEKLLATPSLEGLQADPTPRLGPSPIFGDKITSVVPTSSQRSLTSSTNVASVTSTKTPPSNTSPTPMKQGYQSEKKAVPATIGERRRLSVPIAPKPNVRETSNVQKEQIEQPNESIFSPSVFGYDFTSPQTAPAYPPANILWGSDDAHNGSMDFLSRAPGLLDSSLSSDDPFGFDRLPSQPLPNRPEQTNVRFAGQGGSIVATTATNFGQSLNQSSPATRAYGSGVDPTLLFSSPSRLPVLKERQNAPSRAFNDDSLRPYAYQMQEARRDRASMAIGKLKKRRKPSIDSPAVQAALDSLRDENSQRPAMRRSMTDSVLAPPKFGTAQPLTPVHRRSSPLKRSHDNARRKRTSLALTIDENGRARTETRIIDDSGDSDNGHRMDVDARSDGSSSTSSGDDDGDIMTASNAAMPRLGRFNSSTSHSKKSSYTSLYSSASYQEDPKLPEPKDRPSTAHGRLFGTSKLQTLKEASFGSIDGRNDMAMESDGEDQNAQSELRKVAQQRRQTSLREGSSTLR